jgi:hypothetical protein
MEPPASALHEFYEKLLALVRHARAAPPDASDRVLLNEWADVAVYEGDVVVESTIRGPFWTSSVDHFTPKEWHFFKQIHIDGGEEIPFRAGTGTRTTYWADMDTVVITDPAVIAVARLQTSQITNKIVCELDDDWDDSDAEPAAP